MKTKIKYLILLIALFLASILEAQTQTQRVVVVNNDGIPRRSSIGTLQAPVYIGTATGTLNMVNYPITNASALTLTSVTRTNWPKYYPRSSVGVHSQPYDYTSGTGQALTNDGAYYRLVLPADVPTNVEAYVVMGYALESSGDCSAQIVSDAYTNNSQMSSVWYPTPPAAAQYVYQTALILVGPGGTTLKYRATSGLDLFAFTIQGWFK